jgi:hypothetical protein
LALYGLGMTVNEVDILFRRLAKRVFRGRDRFGVGFVTAAHSLIVSYLHGQFPSKDIDEPLHEIFGETSMLDHPYMSSIGARIGFPVVDLDNASTCIVTSYNGASKGQHQDPEKDHATYRVLRSNGPHDEIRAKDAYVDQAPFLYKY